MTDSTSIFGLTMPEADGSDNFTPDLWRDLAQDVEDKSPGITCMTTTARTALSGSGKYAGRVVYDTTANKLYVSDGTNWTEVTKAALPLAGGTMSGAIAMGGTNKITGLAAGTANGDAVRYDEYSAVKTTADAALPKAGGTMTGKITLDGAPTSSLHAANKGYVDTAMPIGSLVAYAGSSAPTDWLLCYGQAVSRSTYASLFTVLGTTYGTGDGSTTFNLPDLRGRVAAGVDNMGGTTASRITSATSGITGTTLGAAGGDQRLHAHSHGVTDPGHTHTHNRSASTGSNAGNFTRGSATEGTTTSSSSTTGISIDSNTQGGTAQNVQPTMMLNYIIKAA